MADDIDIDIENDRGARTYFTPSKDMPTPTNEETMRNVEEAMQLVSPTAATPTAAPTPTATVPQPSLENGDTVVKDGKGMTMFGKYGRVVDQKTGEEKFINTETGKEEVPRSMQMAGLMGRGVTSDTLQKSGRSWDDALKNQKSESEDLEIKRLENQGNFMRQAHEARVRQNAESHKLAYGVAKYAYDTLLGGGGVVRKSADGNNYRIVKVSGDMLGETNQTRMKMGRKDAISSVYATIQLGSDGKTPIGEPRFDFVVEQGGNVKAGGQKLWKTMTLDEVREKYGKAVADSAESGQQVDGSSIAGKVFGNWADASAELEKKRYLAAHPESQIAGGKVSDEGGTRPTTGTPSARDINAIAGTIERIGGMSPDMFEGGASEQKALIRHLMQQTGFKFDGASDGGGDGGGGLAVQPKNGSGPATVDTGDKTAPAPAGGSQRVPKPVKKATKEQIAEARAAKERLAAKKRDRDWGSTTLADGYTLGDEQKSKDEEGVSFRPVLDKDGKTVGEIYSDGSRRQLGEDGQYAEVPDDEDASWQDEGRTTEELRRRFAANGGKVNDDGSFSIGGEEHLSADERAELGGGSSEGITRKHVRAQTQIAERRAEIARRREAKEKLLRLDARKKFRGNEQRQKDWVERHLAAWDEENDPSVRKVTESDAQFRKSFDWAHGHGMR